MRTWSATYGVVGKWRRTPQRPQARRAASKSMSRFHCKRGVFANAGQQTRRGAYATKHRGHNAAKHKTLRQIDGICRAGAGR
eukprot:11194526-Lingulodinium_polyedra.AAC.1